MNNKIKNVLKSALKIYTTVYVITAIFSLICVICNSASPLAKTLISFVKTYVATMKNTMDKLRTLVRD